MTKQKPSESQIRDALQSSAEDLKRHHKMNDRDAQKLARESWVKQERIKEDK